MMALNPGDLLYIFCIFRDPPDYKYVVCTRPRFPLFFLVNSQPRRTSPDAQILIKRSDFPFLKYDSYIDVSKMVTFGREEIEKAEWKGSLTPSLIQEIREIVRKTDYLPPHHKQIVFENFPFP